MHKGQEPIYILNDFAQKNKIFGYPRFSTETEVFNGTLIVSITASSIKINICMMK